MVQPATVASHRALGLSRVEIWCNVCIHNAEISTDGLPDDFPIPDICLRYRCSKCGSKNLMSRRASMSLAGMSPGNTMSVKGRERTSHAAEDKGHLRRPALTPAGTLLGTQ